MDLKKEGPRLVAEFEKQFGAGLRPRAAISPGRSNLIGEHTDYNGGLVLPIAVDRHTVALFRATNKNRIRVFAASLNASDEFGTRAIRPTRDSKQRWANYVRGTAAALLKRGVQLKGGDIFVTSDLPQGAGLSSSAALETSVGLALLALAGEKMDRQELAFACQEAENRFAGVRSGIMDQTAVGRAEAGNALLLDCESIQVRHVPISLKNYSFAIFNTGVRHTLASSEYNKRRAECEHAARVMKRPNLRAVTVDDLLKAKDRLSAPEHKRVRHVLTENIRVAQFAAALQRGDTGELGRLLLASHYSLAVDYEVSCRELDEVVRQLLLRNAFDQACPGARMTGGGFGGAVVALLKTKSFPEYAEALKPFAKGGSMLLKPVGGARVEKI